MALVDEIVVPASIADLGRGVDTLGLAVQLRLRARVGDIGSDYEQTGCPVTVRTLDVHQPSDGARPGMMTARGGAL